MLKINIETLDNGQLFLSLIRSSIYVECVKNRAIAKTKTSPVKTCF